MTSRIQRIEIRNFKAFREFAFDVEGRHLLVYGPNGSGNPAAHAGDPPLYENEVHDALSLIKQLETTLK